MAGFFKNLENGMIYYFLDLVLGRKYGHVLKGVPIDGLSFMICFLLRILNLK